MNHFIPRRRISRTHRQNDPETSSKVLLFWRWLFSTKRSWTKQTVNMLQPWITQCNSFQQQFECYMLVPASAFKRDNWHAMRQYLMTIIFHGSGNHMGPEPVPIGDSTFNSSEDKHHALPIIIFYLLYEMNGERNTNGQVKYLCNILVGRPHGKTRL
jgi:hypothetical protein